MKVIVDSSALISLLAERDPRHAEALQNYSVIRKHDYELLLPYEVFAETVDEVCCRFGDAEGVRVSREIMALQADGATDFVQTELSTLKRATELYHHDKAGLSTFTECLVMAVADEQGTNYIFGFAPVFDEANYSLPNSSDAKVREG